MHMPSRLHKTSHHIPTTMAAPVLSEVSLCQRNLGSSAQLSDSQRFDLLGTATLSQWGSQRWAPPSTTGCQQLTKNHLANDNETYEIQMIGGSNARGWMTKKAATATGNHQP